MQQSTGSGSAPVIRRKLGRAVFFNCIFFALLICLCAGALAITLFYRSSIRQYQQYISTLLDVTIAECNADDLEKAISTGTTTPGYSTLQNFMNELKNNSEIEYIYAVLPLNLDAEDSMMYVMTGVSADEREIYDDVVGLGDMSGTEYSPKVAAYYMDQFNEHDGITYYSNKTEFGYMYTGMEAIMDSAGNPVCVLAIDIAMNDIHNVMNRFILILLGGFLLVADLFLFGQLHWMRRRVTGPLKDLGDAASSLKERAHTAVSPDDLVFQAPATPENDEIRVLAESLTEMSQDMQSYMLRLQTETMEKQRISSELNMATQIQEGALPSVFPAFPDRPEFDIYASMNPAKEVGGDFYDFFFVDDDHLALVIADVSGKGVPAALFMMISKALLKNRCQSKESPKEVLQIVNNQLCENNDAEMFVTVWLGVLEISTGRLVAANAGHEYPAICRADGQFELIKDKHGFVLAGMEGARYREYELQINHGDTLFLYTDGVPEATDSAEQLYGTDRMLAALNRNPHIDCQSLLTGLREDINSFAGSAPQFDDITMVGIKLY